MAETTCSTARTATTGSWAARVRTGSSATPATTRSAARTTTTGRAAAGTTTASTATPGTTSSSADRATTRCWAAVTTTSASTPRAPSTGHARTRPFSATTVHEPDGPGNHAGAVRRLVSRTGSP